jgi:signal transduction histidine kinase
LNKWITRRAAILNVLLILIKRKKFFIGLFAIYVGVAMLLAFTLYASRFFERQELQTINKRFETRPWLYWTPDSLARLNLGTLLEYHEQHEFPRTWYHWDWTLSWLLENNHPPVANHIVIFNRSLQDEPPDDALAQFPWMQPLQQYPLSRKTVADMVDLLARSGAAAIVLDNDFPQHAPGDEDMAEVLHKWSTVGVDGRKVPIFMVGTVNSGSDSHVVELGVPSRPVGVIADLEKLEPGVDVQSKFLGTTCVSQDPDAVVRGIFLNRKVGDKNYESIILKVLRSLGKPIPKDLPDRMDIDFGCPPKSDIYPVRPLTYLLDPQTRSMLEKGSSDGGDVNVKGAVVFIGDDITDVYSTPFTNDGNNQMSGTEILAHALETVSRRSWPIRLTREETLLYTIFVSTVAGLVWVAWKSTQSVNRAYGARSVAFRLVQDMFVCAILLGFVFFLPSFLFVSSRLLLPMFMPAVAIAFGTLAAIVMEREAEREEKFKLQLKAAEEKLGLIEEKFDAELKAREAEAKTREMLLDRKRRHEFVRRINHDLNAPVSVLNWTVSELQMMELENQAARDKVARLVKSSDKLCELIDQLVQSYDYERQPVELISGGTRTLCDLVQVIDDCVDGQQPLAAIHHDTLIWTKPENSMKVMVNQLELTRVVDNIIRNAIKHNPEGTNVTVSLDSNGSFHIITVADTGKGIAPEHLDRIFEPGFRVEPSTKDGQGLGLDIAKTLIENMGGEITVSSMVKKGTTFKLKIPIFQQGDTINTDIHGNHEYIRGYAKVLADGSMELVTSKREGNGKSSGSAE